MDHQKPNHAPRQAASCEPLAQCYLLGLVDFASCLALQQRLVDEATFDRQGRLTMLVCEHPPLITVGRSGSRAHIRWTQEQLEARGIPVQWVNRGAGCLVHGPGQLAIYPIVSLADRGWSVGDYRRRLRQGIAAALAEQRVVVQARAGSPGLWGRTGQLACLGVAVKQSVTYFGAYLNVSLPRPLTHAVTVANSGVEGVATTISTLFAERQRPVRMASVREAVIRRVSHALGSERFHLYTGHPLLVRRELVREHHLETS